MEAQSVEHRASIAVVEELSEPQLALVKHRHLFTIVMDNPNLAHRSRGDMYQACALLQTELHAALCTAYIHVLNVGTLREVLQDTTTTTEQADELQQVLDNTDKALVMDCKELEYISFAGLRFFMRLKRETEAKGGKVRIINMNEDVADIFHMSGFNNIFVIE